MTGKTLKAWRTERGMSLIELAQMLNVNSPNTVKNWESGADISGPAAMLLDMLIEGKVPFTSETVPVPLRDAMWALEMTLGTWEEINRRRVAGGFTSVTDWIASLVREELGESQSGEPKDGRGAARPYPEMALEAEEGTPSVTDPTGAKSDAAQGVPTVTRQNPCSRS